MAEQHRPENVWTISLLDVQPGEQILEVGFGPGVALQQLLAQGKAAHVTGIDVSPTMVQSARRRNLRAINAGLLDLIRADASQLRALIRCTASMFSTSGPIPSPS